MPATYIQDSELNKVLTTSEVVVLDYTAKWCGPCRVISPFIDQLAEEYADRAQVFKIDLDDNKENAKKFEIRSIPAVLIFKKGEVVERLIGKQNYDTFSKALEKHL